MIRNVVAWVAARCDRPWLVVGKGPSFDRLPADAVLRYRTLALNHVCLKFPADLVHFSDLEAYIDCAPALQHHEYNKYSTAVVMPWHPHHLFKPTRETLDNWMQQTRMMRELAEAGLLLSYNSTVAHKLPLNPVLPILTVRYFSAVAAVSILCAAGVKLIHTVGVDGGTNYSPAFDDKNRLANGRTSFDIQFHVIDQILGQHKAKLVRL